MTNTTTHTLAFDGASERTRKAIRLAAGEYGATYRVQTHGRHPSTTVVTTGDYGYACDIIDLAELAGATACRWTTEVRTPDPSNPAAYFIRTTRNEEVVR